MGNKQNYLTTTTRSVDWFSKIHLNGELVVKPPFQRNPVWTEVQKSFLIDSILRGYPIPEIYMEDVFDDSGNTKYIIVDGQQRIRSILEFLEGEFKINSKDSPEWADMGFDDLSTDEKKRFRSYNFVVRLLPDLDDSEIRSIFQRLNKNNLVLNRQELRQATYWGAFITLMNKLSNEKYWSDLYVFSTNDIRRMLDVEFISELSIAALHGPQNKKDNLDKFYKIYEEEFEQGEELEDSINTVAKEILKILPEIKKTRWRKKTDFYTLFLTLYEYQNEFPLSKDKRVLVHDILVEFGNDIDECVRAEQVDQQKYPDIVNEYVSGIRASTDLASRKRRQNALRKKLLSVFE